MATEEARPYLDGTNWPIHTFVGVASPRRKNVLAAPIGGNVATVIDKYIFGKAAGYDLDEELGSIFALRLLRRDLFSVAPFVAFHWMFEGGVCSSRKREERGPLGLCFRCGGPRVADLTSYYIASVVTSSVGGGGL